MLLFLKIPNVPTMCLCFSVCKTTENVLLCVVGVMLLWWWISLQSVRKEISETLWANVLVWGSFPCSCDVMVYFELRKEPGEKMNLIKQHPQSFLLLLISFQTVAAVSFNYLFIFPIPLSASLTHFSSFTQLVFSTLSFGSFIKVLLLPFKIMY